MTKEQLLHLQRIYNTLLTIETKGENTLIMADCLRALHTLISNIVICEDYIPKNIAIIKGDEGDGEQ